MTLALIYDVHGNLPALETVLADAGDAGVDEYLLGGDYSSFGAWPVEALQRLRELAPATWIRGNWERWAAGRDAGDVPDIDLVRGALAAVRAALPDATIAELADLPQQVTFDDLRACHGSPVSDMRSFAVDPAGDELELLAGVVEPLIAFGHTHLQLHRRASAAAYELVNPGSVGLPFDGDPRAAYALRHDDGRIEPRRVAYDREASAGAVRAWSDGAPWGEAIAATIESGRR